MNINLQPESGSLEEVVVTASGINKEKKSLGYATQIMGKQLDTEIIKGDPDVVSVAQHLTEK
jgi:hypothetical protein